MGLDLVVGEDGALPLPWLAAPLAETLARQRGHALMLHGVDGIGALQFALALAQGWLCESGGAPHPCGRCGSCRLVQARLHPDLMVLLPQALRQSLGWPLVDDKVEGEDGKKKPSRQIRIDEVRSTIDWSAKTSARGRGKVAVLHPAERMNAQAASALLKTLEEPPPGTRLVLVVADPSQLLPTVRSRCQRVALAAPPADQALAWLAGQGVEDAELLLAAASGRPLLAREMAAAGIGGAAWAALPRAVARGQGGALAGWPVPRAVDALHKLCHDAMALATGAPPRYFPRASLPSVGTLAPLVAWSRELARVARHDEHPWHEPLLLDSLVAQGREALTLSP
jgi:DNA polymerase III subunit delta'